MKKQQAAFTLIELLLVIAVIAAMAILGIAAYRQQVMNAKVQKAALQMQVWLQAAQDYYVDNGNWPGSDSATGDATDAKSILETGGYVDPNTGSAPPGLSLAYNPWGNVNSSDTTYTAQEYQNSQNSNDPLFEVSTTIPNTAEASPDAIAQMIAARVPMGSADGPVVTAYINKPLYNGAGGDDNTLIMSVGMYQFNQTNTSVIIPQPSCPAGYNACIDYGVNNWDTSWANPTNPSIPGAALPCATPATDSNGNPVWNLSMQVPVTNNQSGTGGIMAVVSCKKPPEQCSPLPSCTPNYGLSAAPSASVNQAGAVSTPENAPQTNHFIF